MNHAGEIFRRKDGKWSWRLLSTVNGKKVASDAAQGFSRRIDAVKVFEAIHPNYPHTIIGK